MSQKTPQIRLDYLDSMRGITALYVVLFHIRAELLSGAQSLKQTIPLVAALATNWMAYGHLSVDVFIVLSGYVLMIPVVRSKEKQVSPGYISRRARRILPPYYAALFFSVLAIGITHLVKLKLGQLGSSPHNPPFSPSAIISHLLLVHNLKWEWAFEINYPMWSVATEWQIYFLFPLFLLPLWRKVGSIFTVIISCIVGIIPHFIWGIRFDVACPWYVGLFALGMAAADLGFSAKNTTASKINILIPWHVLCVLLLAISLIICQLPNNWWERHLFVVDNFVGLMTMCFIIYHSNWLINSNRKKNLSYSNSFSRRN